MASVEVVVSIWMPGVLKVDPFPTPRMTHFEWYVPVDESTHRYLITWGQRCSDDADREEFERDVRETWRRLVPEEFNNDDVFAREAMAEFYSQEDGWYRERLYRPDLEITMFRKFFSEHARALQVRRTAFT